MTTAIDDDRITDPRGLAVDPKENLLFLNSGADRVLAISSQGRVVRETGRIEGLNPGGWHFRPGWPVLRWVARNAHNHRLVDQP
jgi:hypothetical protein